MKTKVLVPHDFKQDPPIKREWYLTINNDGGFVTRFFKGDFFYKDSIRDDKVRVDTWYEEREVIILDPVSQDADLLKVASQLIDSIEGLPHEFDEQFNRMVYKSDVIESIQKITGEYHLLMEGREAVEFKQWWDRFSYNKKKGILLSTKNGSDEELYQLFLNDKKQSKTP
jgi:hypothetical protein